MGWREYEDNAFADAFEEEDMDELGEAVESGRYSRPLDDVKTESDDN